MPPAVTKHLLIPHTELWCRGMENHKFSAAQQSLVTGEHFFEELECGLSHVTSVSLGSLLVCHRSLLGFGPLPLCIWITEQPF